MKKKKKELQQTKAAEEFNLYSEKQLLAVACISTKPKIYVPKRSQNATDFYNHSFNHKMSFTTHS